MDEPDRHDSKCHICNGTFVNKLSLLEHIRLLHPDDYPDIWPDGALVYYDEEIA